MLKNILKNNFKNKVIIYKINQNVSELIYFEQLYDFIKFKQENPDKEIKVLNKN